MKRCEVVLLIDNVVGESVVLPDVIAEGRVALMLLVSFMGLCKHNLS